MPVTTVQVPTEDGTADCLAARPEGEGPFPGVLLYPDAFGPRPVLEKLADELAGHGYSVLVPNLYYRRGAAPVIDLPEHIAEENRGAIFAQLMPLIEEHTVERVLRDADAYLRFLNAQPEVAPGPVAVAGYCLGAVLALRTAAAHPAQVAAAAGFHPGALVTEAPDSPHRSLDGLAAEVHLGFAEGDITPDALKDLNAALDATGVSYTTETYPGTVHGFTMADTSAFSATGLQQHWDNLLPLLRRALG